MDKIRSEHAINRIHSALLELLGAVGYDKITVSQIAEKAQMNRTTFYLFFASKREMLEFFSSTIIDCYISDLIRFLRAEDGDQYAILAHSFAELKKEAPIVRVAWSYKDDSSCVYPQMVDSIEGALLADFKARSMEVGPELSFFANLYAQSATATVFWWLGNCDSCSEDLVARLVLTSTYEGMAHLLPGAKRCFNSGVRANCGDSAKAKGTRQ